MKKVKISDVIHVLWICMCVFVDVTFKKGLRSDNGWWNFDFELGKGRAWL